MRCDGKIVLVVGAGSGIGRSTVEVFAENGGAAIVAADITLMESSRPSRVWQQAEPTAWRDLGHHRDRPYESPGRRGRSGIRAAGRTGVNRGVD